MPRPGEEPPWVRDWLEKAMSEIQRRDWEKTLREDPSDPKFHEGCSDACEYKFHEGLSDVSEDANKRSVSASAWVNGFREALSKLRRQGRVVGADPNGSPYRRHAEFRRLTAEEAAEVAVRAAERSRRWARFMLGLTVTNVLLQLLRVIFG